MNASEIEALRVAALEAGNDFRVFDRRYITQADPANVRVTEEFVVFERDAIDVLETGRMAGPPRRSEPVFGRRLVSLAWIIQIEECAKYQRA